MWMLGITGFFAVMTPVTLGNDTWVVLVSQALSRWRERMTSMSFHSGGALPPQRHARSSTCHPQHRPQRAGPVTRGGAESRRNALHEGGLLLEEGGVYCG